MKIKIFNLQTSNVNPKALRSPWFSFERCFKNLLDTLDSRAILTVIFDGNDENSFIHKYRQKYPFDIIKINSKEKEGEYPYNKLIFETIRAQNINKDDLIMTAESDYLYLDFWMNEVFFIYQYNLNYKMNETFCTLYEHPDKYIYNNPNRIDEYSMYKDLKSQIYFGQNRYWRETPSTCNSFIMKKSLFDEDFDILSAPIADSGRFEILGKKGRKVLSPLPSYSCHVGPFLPFLINWENLSNSVVLL